MPFQLKLLRVPLATPGPHPSQITSLGTTATMALIHGSFVPASSANSAPLLVPITPMRVASTSGCAASQARTCSSRSTGMSAKAAGSVGSSAGMGPLAPQPGGE